MLRIGGRVAADLPRGFDPGPEDDRPQVTRGNKLALSQLFGVSIAKGLTDETDEHHAGKCTNKWRMPAFITERWTGKGWELGLSGLIASRHFDVSGVTTEQDAINTVRQQEVDINDEHPFQHGLLCNAVRLTEVVGPLFYRVSAFYAVAPNGKWVVTDDATEAFSLPTQLEFHRGIKSVPTDREYPHDLDEPSPGVALPIVNSAGTPFDPAPEKPLVVRYCTAERFEPFWNIDLADEYEDSVNSDRLTMGPLAFLPGQVLCTCIEPVGKYSLDSDKVRIRYEFEFDRTNAHPFQTRQIDRGSMGWYSSGSDVISGPICHVNADGSAGDPVGQDVLLDGTGKPIDQSLGILDAAGVVQDPVACPDDRDFVATEGASSDFIILIFKTRKKADFQALQI